MLSSELRLMKNQLAQYQIREQDRSLAADPQRGEAYQALRGEVLELVDYCQSHGNTDVDVESAFQVLLSQNLGKLLGNQKQKTEQQAIRKLMAQNRASPGSLKGAPPARSGFDGMSDAEFAKQVELAKRGGLLKR